MSSFEFVFSLFSILLGLALAEVLGGLAKMVEARRRLRIGWLTPLLAAVVVVDLTLFWRVVWRARDGMPDTSAALFGALIISGLYYFAAVLVFPDDIADRDELDSHYVAEKTNVFLCIFLANVAAYAARYALMGWNSFAAFSLADWAGVLVGLVACLIGAFAKNRAVNVGVLLLLLFLDLQDPFLSVFADGR